MRHDRPGDSRGPTEPKPQTLVAVANWSAPSFTDCLDFQVGESFSSLESSEEFEDDNWIRVSSNISKKVGWAPSTLLVPCKDNSIITQEARGVILLWGQIYKQMFILRDLRKQQLLEKAIDDMINWRHQLISDSLTKKDSKDLQKKITDKIDAINRELDLEMTARDEDGRRLSMDVGCVTLYNSYTRAVGSRGKGGKVSDGGLPVNLKHQHLANYHLHVTISHIAAQPMPQDEELVIYCQLYSDRRPGYVSERWCPNARQPQPQGVFLDLGSLEQCLDLHIVVQIFRIGRLLVPDGGVASAPAGAGVGGGSGGGGVNSHRRSMGNRHHSEQSGWVVKRPVSGGMASLQSLFQSAQHNQRKANQETGPAGGIYARQTGVEIRLHTVDEKEFHHLHELLLKNSNRVSSSPVVLGPAHLNLQLAVLGPRKDLYPLIFKESNEVRRLGFPPVIMPGHVRNDLYLTLERGQFEKGGGKTPGISSGARNVEVRIGLYDTAGHEVVGAVVSAAGCPDSPQRGPSYRLPATYYHNNTPAWGETFRIQIPLDLYRAEKCHIRLEYSHCSGKEKQERKLFGFSWLKLMQSDNTVIPDGVLELPVFKVASGAEPELNPAIYLANQSSNSGDEDNSNQVYPRSTKEVVTVHTLLCSTKLTQNLDLMALLQWRSHTDKIPDILARIMKTGGEELVKFLQDILDALFAMFSTEDGNSTDHSGLVFHVLVYILAFLQEPRFEQFHTVIDAYLEDHFAAALVYKGLLTCVNHCAEMVPSTVKQDPIRKCFQSLNYIFKFIVKSRQLFSRATGGQNEESFRYEVHLMFNSFIKMLSYQLEQVLPTQVVFLNNLSTIYPSLAQVMPVIDIAKLVTLTLDSLGQDRSQYLQRAALCAARATLQSPLWSDQLSRALLLTPCLGLVAQHLQYRRELEIATSFLLEIVTSFQDVKDSDECGEESSWFKDVTVLAKIILGPLGLAVVAEDDCDSVREDELLLGQAGLTAGLMGVLELLTPSHHLLLWREQTPVLGRLLVVLTEVISRPAFPTEWTSIRLALARTIFQTIQCVGEALPHLTFDKQLWTGYFRLAVNFITAPLVQLELVKRQGRYYLGMDDTEDYRVPMASHLMKTWQDCPEQIQLIPTLVGPLLEVTLLPLRELRQTVLPIIINMMETEQNHKGNFRQMENELIDKLDILINDNKGDEEYRQIFNTLMQDLVQHLDPTWRESGQIFMTSVTRLLERLLDYRDVLQGDENKNKRMSCTVNLLKFYRDDINRQEMYIRYIYKLHHLHLSVGNHAEAAFTLQLHANLLDWNTKMLHADLRFPTQQEWQRKEHLYQQIIQLFDVAKLWECSIPLCKELSDLYEKRIYDYNKLSLILKTQADFFTKIITEFRPEPEYFRVGYYGKAFPLFVRNKEFIYRGLEYEKITEFTQRMAKEFPEAVVSSNLSEDVAALSESEGMTIQIFSVRPEARTVGDYFGPEVPDKIRHFFAVNKVDTFLFDRPFHKGKMDPSNEFKTLWIERTRLVTANEFPGILKWFQVVKKDVDQVDPVDYACETVLAKNQELRSLINEFSVKRDQKLAPFTMRLQGNIDAAVNGGIAKYKTAFFTEEFIQNHPSRYHAVERLAVMISEQSGLLEDGLMLHGDLAPPSLQPLHARLLEVFHEMKSSLDKESLLPSPRFRKVSRIVNTPLPPIPGEQSYGMKKDDLQDDVAASLYGKFTDVADNIYCRPSEMSDVGASPSMDSLSFDPRFQKSENITFSQPTYSSSSLHQKGPRVSDPGGSHHHHPPPLPPRVSSVTSGGSGGQTLHPPTRTGKPPRSPPYQSSEGGSQSSTDLTEQTGSSDSNHRCPPPMPPRLGSTGARPPPPPLPPRTSSDLSVAADKNNQPN